MNIQNTQGIKRIDMMPIAHCLCAIGKDWYTIKFEITIYPEEEYPDYMDVMKWLTENVEGRELNIEDAVDLIYGYLTNSLSCEVEVVADVSDASTHCPVRVVK